MKIKYSKDAIKFLSKLDQKSITRIRSAVEGLTKSPPVGDIKPLQGYSDGRMRLRIKKLVRAWDPDFTKVTSEEARQIAHAEESGFIDADEIDWDNLGGITQ